MPAAHQRKSPPAAPPGGPAPEGARRAGVEKAPPTHKLETDENRAEVIRLLAGGTTQRAIAQRFGCRPSSVGEFRNRHIGEINRLRGELQDAARAEDQLWIAHRIDRLGVLQDQLEELLEAVDNTGSEELPELTRTIVTVLHEAAEQLGQLPARSVQVANTIVNYRLGGVDLEQL